MEKLLEEACEEVLGKVKTQIFLSLAAEGVKLDPLTLQVSSLASAQPFVSSVRIYSVAEGIRDLFEREMSTLARNASLPVEYLLSIITILFLCLMLLCNHLRWMEPAPLMFNQTSFFCAPSTYTAPSFSDILWSF